MPPMTCRMSCSCSARVSASSEFPVYARITAYMLGTSFRFVDQKSIRNSDSRQDGRGLRERSRRHSDGLRGSSALGVVVLRFEDGPESGIDRSTHAELVEDAGRYSVVISNHRQEEMLRADE